MPSPPGSPVKRWPPQSVQNDLARPSAGFQARTTSAPVTSRNALASTIPFYDQSAQLRRWQRLQWQ